jgi:ATP-dependent Clp protease adaptor protein ClpS
MPDRDKDPGRDENVLTKERIRTQPPRMYKVLLHNDDYTPMEFVVMVLEVVFRKANPEAVRIMLNVHKRGIGVCGTYPFAVAETKVQKVRQLARSEGHPLRCSMEEA